MHQNLGWKVSKPEIFSKYVSTQTDRSKGCADTITQAMSLFNASFANITPKDIVIIKLELSQSS